jgi:hypothetical protein
MFDGRKDRCRVLDDDVEKSGRCAPGPVEAGGPDSDEHCGDAAECGTQGIGVDDRRRPGQIDHDRRGTERSRPIRPGGG